MKAKFLTPALAALFLGTAAYAHDCDDKSKKEKEKSSSTTQSSLMTAPEPTFAAQSESKKEKSPDNEAQARDNPSSGGNTLVGQGEVGGENTAQAGTTARDRAMDTADQEGIGGSGKSTSESMEKHQPSQAVGPSSNLESDTAVGGSGKVEMKSESEKSYHSSESVGSSSGSLQSDTAVGGSGQMGPSGSSVCPPGSEATGGSGESSQSLSPSQDQSWSSSSSTSVETGTGGSEAFDTAAARRLEEERAKDDDKSDMRGLTVLAGGGVEGYTQELASELAPGPTWGVTAALKPTSVLGLELGYSGATNEIKDREGTSGADIVRNGGQAVATLGLAASAVQPYVLGGIGISRYSVRAEGDRFSDDTTGQVPVGLGLRTHIGDFTADARVGYNFLFDQEFAGGVDSTGPDDNFANTGRYQGTLNIGTTF